MTTKSTDQTIIVNDSTIRIFISYRNISPSKEEARALAQRLITAGFKKENVFFDQTQLKAGDLWAQKIFDTIRQSDVLIVLLQAGKNKDSTARSEWVQREVDVARGAHVSILPIKLVGEDDLSITSQVAEYLAIRDHQFLTYGTAALWMEAEQRDIYEQQNLANKADHDNQDTATQQQLHIDHFNKLSNAEREQHQQQVTEKSDRSFIELVHLINTLSQRTRAEQRKWMTELQQLRRKDHAENNAKVFSRAINRKTGVNIHLSTGDLTELKDVQIDAIVNSENDYMQLARMFELNSLSVTLRFKGAHFVNGRLMDDTIQNQLNQQIKAGFAKQGLPVMLGQVIPTHAGHPESYLVQTKQFRYILHAATIHFDAIFSDEPLTPVVSKLGITTVVKNCLDKIEEINAANGDIILKAEVDKNHQDPNEYRLRDIDKSVTAPSVSAVDMPFQPIKSIIFPLLSTGQAGRPVDKVIDPMLHGIKQWFEQVPDTCLKDVYLAVFVEDHIEAVKSAMGRVFPQAFDDKS